MHSEDIQKEQAVFEAELHRMRVADDFDFSGFVFVAPFSLSPAPLTMHFDEARFLSDFVVDNRWYKSRFWRERVEFGGHVSFAGAQFSTATFDGAEFVRLVSFHHAHFGARAAFNKTVFAEGVTFAHARFAASVTFVGTSFGPKIVEDVDPVDSKKTVTFVETVFEKPELVVLRDINVNAQQGLRLRARECDIEKLRFENIRWHREWGRIVLQDELDLRAAERWRPPGKSTRRYLRNIAIQSRYGSSDGYPKDSHTSIIIAYKRLIRNFDAVLDFDAAEDAFRGAMEMKRLAPANRPFDRYLQGFYSKFSLLGSLASWFTIVAMYKLVSEYGSSYRRALIVLGTLLVTFGVIYAQDDLALSHDVTSTAFLSHPIGMGIWASTEVASFQREPTVIIASAAGRLTRLIETIMVPGQLAIFLLALRRRFKR